MEIKTWEEAENVAATYVHHISQAEQYAEALKEFAERRQAQVGKARVLGPVILGFRKVAPSVQVPTEAMDWLRSFWGGRFTELKSVPRKPELKRFLEKVASTEALAACREQGIVLVAGYEAFHLKLARNEQ
jgi:hypothetical protein